MITALIMLLALKSAVLPSVIIVAVTAKNA